MYTEAETLPEIITSFFGINKDEADMCYEVINEGNHIGLNDRGAFNIYIMFGEW
jgi:hypothetical protein